MRVRQSHVFESCRGARGFLDDNATLLDEVNKSGARKALDDVVTQTAAHAANQDVGARTSKGETENQNVMCLAIRSNFMKPIAQVARMELRNVPNFVALTLPPFKIKGARFVAAAEAMADTATPYVQTFVNAGLPANFLDQFRQAAQTARQSLDVRAQSLRARVGATEGLIAEEKRGSGVLKLLDALVIPKLGTDDVKLAQWKSARRVRAKSGPAVGSASTAGTAGPGSTAAPVSTGSIAPGSPGTTAAAQPVVQPVIQPVE
jgi:hypothetical protein